MNELYKCRVCKKEFDSFNIYEYRGSFSCEQDFNEMQDLRNFDRGEIIKEESAKTDCFKGLDLGDNVIGKANREILKSKIEIAGKESGRLKLYERPI